jgi:hypothetical protein
VSANADGPNVFEAVATSSFSHFFPDGRNDEKNEDET